MAEEKDPVIALLETVFQNLGNDIDDYYLDDFRKIEDIIGAISRKRKRNDRQLKSEKLTLIDFIEALAKKAAKYEQAIKSVRARLDSPAEQPPSNPEMKILSRWGKEFLDQIEFLDEIEKSLK